MLQNGQCNIERIVEKIYLFTVVFLLGGEQVGTHCGNSKTKRKSLPVPYLESEEIRGSIEVIRVQTAVSVSRSPIIL